MPPFFSILVPTYNVAQYLGPALDSLLAQTDQDWEAIVVNDGSTDNTPAVMTEYAARDPRFRLFHKENGGTASALNEGLKHVQGKWICWLSSDDLFDPRKLEIHREWITKRPDAKFFCSMFRQLDNETGKVTDEPLWRPVPEPQWQVIEMLRGTFIHGNSVCVQRELWDKVGRFDPACGYAQDYDMWLRLLRVSPVVLIPEYTCTTRESPLLGSRRFVEARSFFAAKAGILFLNANRFEKLFPSVNLACWRGANAAVNRAMDVACSRYSVVNVPGAHPALVGRIVEWIGDVDGDWRACRLRRIIRRRCQLGAETHADSPLGFMFRVVRTVVGGKRKSRYWPVSFAEVVEANYWWKCSQEDTAQHVYARYLEECEGITPDAGRASHQWRNREVVLVLPKGGDPARPVVYGAQRATMEICREVARTGARVLLAGDSECAIGMRRGVLFAGWANELDGVRMLRDLQPFDVLGGVSRADIFRGARVKRPVVYHHNVSSVEGIPSVSLINRAQIPVVVVSKYAADAMIRRGVAQALLSVVPNGYDSGTFRMDDKKCRTPHSLVFAGRPYHSKGADVAVAALQRIRAEFPDATLEVCGDCDQDWQGVKECLLRDEWFDTSGRVDWSRIMRDVEGLTCHGEIDPKHLAAIFQRCDVLVVPSRIPESFGLVSVEAQACGCLPILPKQGGFPETLVEGITGVTYELNTADGLAAKVMEMWEIGWPGSEVRKASALRCQAEHRWTDSADLFMQAIDTSRSYAGTRPVMGGLFWQWESFRDKHPDLSRVVVKGWRVLRG